MAAKKGNKYIHKSKMAWAISQSTIKKSVCSLLILLSNVLIIERRKLIIEM